MATRAESYGPREGCSYINSNRPDLSSTRIRNGRHMSFVALMGHSPLTGCPSLHCYPRLCGGVSLILHLSRDDAPIAPTVVPGEGLKFGVYFNDILWYCTRRA